MAKPLNKFASDEFLCVLPDYVMIRDCFKGQRAIKAKGETYLPRLKNQTDEDYGNYLFRSLFFPITGKTATSLVGMATHKAPDVLRPSEMDRYFVDTESSYQFTEFYVNVFMEIVLMGRYGVLIDAPKDNVGDPQLVPYLAENIVRFEPDANGNMELLLRECYDEPIAGNRWETKEKTRYRHCFIEDNVYVQEVLDDELNPVANTRLVPTFTGSTIDFIPFVPFGASGVHYNVDKPPMIDIATINVSHYLTSADLEWGRHIVGLPTPVVSGVDTGTVLKIGGTQAWVLPVAEAKAYFLEFQGQGLQSLEKALAEKVGLMASISARLVDQGTRGSEAAETVRLRYMSEAATLIHIITAVENGLNMMYNMLAKLLKVTGEVKIKFSREILGLTITFKDLQILFEAYLNGALSKESLLYNLKRLEATDPSRTDEQELAEMKEPPPAVLPKPAPDGLPRTQLTKPRTI